MNCRIHCSKWMAVVLWWLPLASVFAQSVTVYKYNAAGHITSTYVTDGVNGPTRFRTDTDYDKLGRKVLVTQFAFNTIDNRNITTAYDYDVAGNLITNSLQTDAGPSITSYVYDTLGRNVTVKGPSLNVDGNTAARVIYEYDNNSNVTKQLTRSLSNAYTETVTEYDALNRPTKMFMPTWSGGTSSVTRKHYFDSQSRELGEYVYAGNTSLQRTRFIYDDLGRVVTKARLMDPTTNTINFTTDEVVTYVYDMAGRVLQETMHDSGSIARPLVTTHEYDGFGRIVKMTDPKGNIDEFIYNSQGFPIRYKRTAGTTVQQILRDYDTHGHVINEAFQGQVSSDERIQNSYVYDCLGRRLVVFSWKYDPIADEGQWQKTMYEYDLLGRQTLVREDADGVDRQTGYIYSKDGSLSLQIAGVTSGTLLGGQTTKYEYSPEGKVSRVIYPDQYAANGPGIEYLYYANGAVRQKKDQAGKTIDYIYDARGQIVTKANLLAPETYWVTYEYDGLGRVVAANKGKASDPVADSAIAYQYDALSRVIRETQSIGGQPAREVEKKYDQAGNRTQMVYPSLVP